MKFRIQIAENVEIFIKPKINAETIHVNRMNAKNLNSFFFKNLPQ